MTPPRLSAFLLLALANLLWSGNWIAGRALRDSFDPISLNFWRWAIATLALAPFALPALRGQGALLRRHAGILLILSLTGIAVFQSLVYLGLRSTTAVNAVLINSSIPLFILLCSWLIERERASPRQIAGMLVSLAGILVILVARQSRRAARARAACRRCVDPARHAGVGHLFGAAQAPAAGARRPALPVRDLAGGRGDAPAFRRSRGGAAAAANSRPRQKRWVCSTWG